MGWGQMHELGQGRPDGGPCDASTCPMTASRRNGVAVVDVAESVWRKDGSSFPIEDSSTPIVSEDGSRLGSVITSRATTASRAVERMKSELISVDRHEPRAQL